MSSSTFSAELQPDCTLRWIVLLSGAGLAGIGILLIVTLPLHAAAIVTAAGTWLALCAQELVRIRRGFALCRRMRIAPGGSMLLLQADGQWRTARLLAGSVLLRRAGWLLFETQDGHRCAELLQGRCRESDDWRRLQVIWRHVGATP